MKKFKEGDLVIVTKKGMFNGIQGTITALGDDKKIASVDFGTSGQWFFNRDDMENISGEKQSVVKQLKTKK